MDEEPPRRAEDAELCIIEARSRRRRYELIRRWNNAVGRDRRPAARPGHQPPGILLNQYLESIGAAFAWEDSTWYELRERLQACGVRVPHEAASASLAALADTLRTAALHVREKDLAAWLDRVRRHLAGGAAEPQASVFWALLLDAFMASAWENWGQIARTVWRIQALTGEVARLDDLTRLARRGGPGMGQPDRGIPW